MFRKIIIFLFEKYCLDYWIDIQNEKQRLEFKQKNNLSDDELEEALIDADRERYREYWEAGAEYGYLKAIKE